MLRFYFADLSADITFTPGYEPPRPTLRPRRRRTSLPSLADTGEIEPFLYDGGLALVGRSVRFVSSEAQGFATAAQVATLIDMYEAGGAFKIQTNLLATFEDVAVTYNALWDPGAPPEFTPADPGGQLYFVDLAVLVKEE